MTGQVLATIEHGELRYGMWCTRCGLPSIVETDVLLVTDRGVDRMGAVRVCTEHGEDWDEA